MIDIIPPKTVLRLYVFGQLCKTNLKRKYGDWAVISGATDGIGLAMARELAKQGLSIVVIGRSEEKLERTKLSLEQEGNAGEILTIKIDLSDSSIDNFESIRSKIDPENRDIGILINNAGSMPSRLMRYIRYDFEKVRNMVNLNVLATLCLTRMIMPGMLDRGKGLVVNVSSILAHTSAPFACVYAPTKSFMSAFSKQLQQEYSGHPIDIINLTPGPVHTKLLTDLAKFKNPNVLCLSPDDFARTAVNAFSTRIGEFCGCFVHEIINFNSKICHKLGLADTLIKLSMYLYGTSYDISPVARRKKQHSSATDQAASNNQATS